jgi:hypothetical protein
MMLKTILALAVILTATLNTAVGAPEGAAVSAKHWPPGYFYRYKKISIKEKEKLLTNIDHALKKLQEEKIGLIAKGTILGEVRTDVRVYERLLILDESGLIIIAHQVPNIYYQYRGNAPLNPNIYIVVKNPRVNVTESYIRYGFVVEGQFWAYADKFITAIMKDLENIDRREKKD